jgi:hypothetical protein
MKPITPIDPGQELGPTERIAVLCAPDVCKHDPKHPPLPVLVLGDVENEVVTRWRLTDEERAAVAAGADLWIWQTLGSGGFPPILPMFQAPRVGLSCPHCRHGKVHDREGTRCQFCPCDTGWKP